MDNETRKTVTKKFLKQMPIWSYFEDFHTSLRELEHDCDRYLEGLKNRNDRVEQLPELNPKKRLVRLTVKNDEDIVVRYTKVDGQYVKRKERDKLLVENCPTPEQRSLNESLAMLREQLHAKDEVYAMVIPGKPWIKCTVLQIYNKLIKNTGEREMIIRLRAPPEYDSRILNVSKYAVARIQNHSTRLKAAKRVIAGLTSTKLMPGIIGQEPSEINKHRYLVLMDLGSASYYYPNQVYPILGQSARPWEDCSQLRPGSNNIQAALRHFFYAYPRRHLIEVPTGSDIEVSRDGSFISAQVVSFDCDTITVLYHDNKEESIYRGSSRLIKQVEIVQNQLRDVRSFENLYPELLFNMHNYLRAGEIALGEDYFRCLSSFRKVFISRGHNTARKSTTAPTKHPKRVINFDGAPVRDIAMLRGEKPEKFNLDNFSDHHTQCKLECLYIDGVRTEIKVEDFKKEFFNESDLKVPLLLGWKRGLFRVKNPNRSIRRIDKISKKEGKSEVIYIAPCGRVVRLATSIRHYLRQTNSRLDVDYFCFEVDFVPFREMGPVDATVYMENIAADKYGRPLENKCISVLNPDTEESLPIDFEYRNESFPHPVLAAKGFSFNFEFKSGCNCEDDCYSRRDCSCHQLNESLFQAPKPDGRTTQYEKGDTVTRDCQYRSDKRLKKQILTGIFECNSLCRCSSKCNNRVVQNGIRFRLQIRRFPNKGWGVVTLDDIPPYAFICTYAAELLDNADEYGNSDMYYADLDYISVNEREKKRLYLSSDQDGGILHHLNSSDFTLDARMQGNVGRFFNHSCEPNSYVQNVFIETQDPRFPIVAFFSHKHIKAQEEITWNYNYEKGSIAGRRIACHCGAPHCNGWIL